MKFLLTSICLLFFLSISLKGNAALVYQDTIQLPVEYKGYRLHVSGLKILKEKSGQLKMSCKLTNTGREPIDFQNTRSMALLQLVFDRSLLDPKLIDQTYALRQGIYRELGTKIELGQTINDFTFSANPNWNTLEKTVKKEAPELTNTSPPASKEPGFSTKTTVDTFQFVKQAETTCADMVIDSVWVLKRNKKTAEIMVSVKNLGKGAANLGFEKSVNMGLRTYLSGTPRLTRGAISLQFSEVKKEGQLELKSGEHLEIPVKISLKKKTRYMNIFIFSLEIISKIEDCDRTNNTRHLFFE